MPKMTRACRLTDFKTTTCHHRLSEHNFPTLLFLKKIILFFFSQNPCPNPTFPNFCYRICQHLQSVCRLLTTFISSSMLDTQLGQRHDEGWEGGGSPVLATTTPAATYLTSMADLPTPPPSEKFKINNSQLQNTCLHLFT